MLLKDTIKGLGDGSVGKVLVTQTCRYVYIYVSALLFAGFPESIGELQMFVSGHVGA